jgi:uncharacterized protein YunC (DUF1805 family)
MFEHRKIKIGRAKIELLIFKLSNKNLLVLKGSKGYIMCGYLNLKVAEKFKDTAIKIIGVSSLKEALSATVASCTSSARKLGVYKGQPVKDALKIIA